MGRGIALKVSSIIWMVILKIFYMILSNFKGLGFRNYFNSIGTEFSVQKCLTVLFSCFFNLISNVDNVEGTQQQLKIFGNNSNMLEKR